MKIHKHQLENTEAQGGSRDGREARTEVARLSANSADEGVTVNYGVTGKGHQWLRFPPRPPWLLHHRETRLGIVFFKPSYSSPSKAVGIYDVDGRGVYRIERSFSSNERIKGDLKTDVEAHDLVSGYVLWVADFVEVVERD